MGRGRCPEGLGREMGKALAGLWWSPMTTRLSVIGQACAVPMCTGPSLDTWFTAQQLLDLGQVRQIGRSGRAWGFSGTIIRIKRHDEMPRSVPGTWLVVDRC